MKNIKKTNFILYVLTLIIGNLSVFGMYPLTIGYIVAAFVEGANAWILILLGILSIGRIASMEICIEYTAILFLIWFVVFIIKRKKTYISSIKVIIGLSLITLCVKITNVIGYDLFVLRVLYVCMETLIICSAFAVLRKGISYFMHNIGQNNITTEESISISVLGTMVIVGILNYLDINISIVKVSVIYIVVQLIIYLISIFSHSEEERESFIRKNYGRLADERLYEYAESINRLSKTLYKNIIHKAEISKDDVNGILDGVLERYCTRCVKCDECWNNNFTDTYSVAGIIIESGVENGNVSIDNLPNAFVKKCKMSRYLVDDTNLCLERARIDLRWNNRLLEAREAMAGQLYEMSEAIHDFSKHLYDVSALDRRLERRIIERARWMEVKVSDVCCFQNMDKRLTIIINAKALKGSRVTVNEVATMLSELFEKRIVPQKGERIRIPMSYDNVTFIEESEYKVYTGVARYSKSHRFENDDKNEEGLENADRNGDNYSIVFLDNGEMVMILSDGMGTGEKACNDSESVVDILENFIEAGFDKESSIKLLNSVMLLRGEENRMTTVDIGIINLNRGICEFVKIGSAASFIKKKENIEVIESDTLPIGMFDKPDYEKKCIQIENGDMVIMVTDGVTDSIKEIDDKERGLMNIIQEIDTENPQIMANMIIERIAGDCDKIQDDMSVLVATVWKRENV